MNIVISLLTIAVIPLLLIKTFSSIDEDIGEEIKCSIKDIFIIILVAIFYIEITKLFSFETSRFVNMSILTGYLVFMSYTDQKTKLLYSIISILMIILETTWLFAVLNSVSFTKYDLLLIIVVLAMIIMSRLGFLGFGDVLVYVVIIIYELIYSLLPFWDILINYTIANTLFVVITGIKRVITNNNDKNQPFTLCIAISTFLCNLLLF